MFRDVFTEDGLVSHISKQPLTKWGINIIIISSLGNSFTFSIIWYLMKANHLLLTTSADSKQTYYYYYYRHIVNELKRVLFISFKAV